MDGRSVFLRQLSGVGRVPVEAQSCQRCAGRGFRRGWGHVLHDCPDHRSHLGTPSLGHLVDLGCAPHDHAGAVAYLRKLSGTAAFFGGRTDSSTGGGAGHLRIRGRAHRLHVDPLVPYTASVTCHGRRGKFRPRSSHAARLFLEPGGVHLRGNRADGGSLPLTDAGGKSRSYTRRGGTTRRRTMTGPVALKAAYIVTWVILLGYLGSLLRR